MLPVATEIEVVATMLFFSPRYVSVHRLRLQRGWAYSGTLSRCNFRRLKATLGTSAQNVMRFKATLGDLRRYNVIY